MTSGYSFDNAWSAAHARLRALEARFDPGTIRHLQALGVSKGWRCLEIGAGAGSIAAWLCEQVDADGSVMATDLDTRLIDDMAGGNLAVLRHDVVGEELPVAEFNLVHSRALLSHLPDRDRVLGKMVAALRPGGWLLCEELDSMTITLVAPEDPQARELYLRVETAIADTMASRGHVYDYGRRLSARLAAAGLVELGAEGRMLLRWPGADATVARLTAEQLKVEVLATGALTQADFEAYAQLLENPAFLAQSALMIAAWGHRPG